MELFVDQVALEAVLVAGGTTEAAAVLNIPQSSISRRARNFATLSKLTLTRRRKGYAIEGGKDFFFELQNVARRFRYLGLTNRWSVHPGLAAFDAFRGPVLPGQRLALPEVLIEESLSFGLIDQFLVARFIPPTSPSLELGIIPRIGLRLAIIAQSDIGEKRPALVLDTLSEIGELKEYLCASGWSIASGGTPGHACNLKLCAEPPFNVHPKSQKVWLVGFLELAWKYPTARQPLADWERENIAQFEPLFFTRLLSLLLKS